MADQALPIKIWQDGITVVVVGGVERAIDAGSFDVQQGRIIAGDMHPTDLDGGAEKTQVKLGLVARWTESGSRRHARLSDVQLVGY